MVAPQEKCESNSPTEESLFGTTGKEAPEKTETESALPQLYMLMTLQKNMFFDAALQSMGYVILGTVFKRRPDLNDNKHYLDLTFTPAEHNKCWQDFGIQQRIGGQYRLADVTTNFDKIVEQTTCYIENALESSGGRLVAGTLRIFVTMHSDGMIHQMLTWIERKPDAK